MTEFTTISLGADSLGYIRECLGYGKSLASRVAARARLESGRVTTVLPRGTELASALEFHYGGKLPTPDNAEWLPISGGVAVPIPNTHLFLVETVREFLESGTGHIGIFENSLASADDPYVGTMSSRVLTFGDEVYHLLTPSEIGQEKVLEAIHDAYSMPIFLGVLASLPAEDLSLLQAVRELSMDQLDSIASNIVKLVVGAYDGEGFLLWQSGQEIRYRDDRARTGERGDRVAG